MKFFSNISSPPLGVRPLARLKGALLMLMLSLALPSYAAVVFDLTSDKNPVAPGEQTIVRMTVSNDGSLPENGMTVTLGYPAGMNNLSEILVLGGLNAGQSCFIAGSNTICTAGESLVFNIATLNPGASRNYALPVSVAAATANGTDIDWVAEITRDANSDVLAGSTHTLSVDTNAVTTLAVDQSLSPAAPGEEMVYTLRYGNPTTGNVTNTSVSVTLPANTTLVSASGSPTVVGNELTWAAGTLPAQSHRREIVRATVNGGNALGSQLTVTGQLTGTANFLATERTTQQTAIVGTAGALAVNLYVNPLPARPGEQTLLTIDVSNTSFTPVLDASVSLRYPEAVANLNESLALGGLDAGNSCFRSGSGTICTVNEVLLFPIAALNPGQSRRYSVPVSVATATAPGSLIDWDLRLFDGVDTRQVRTLTVPVDDNAVGTLDIVQSKDPVQPGDTLTYTVRYGNTSAGNISAGTLSMVLPDDTTLASASGSPTVAGNELTWSIGTVLAESHAAQTITVNVGATVGTGSQLPVTAEFSGTANFRPMVRQRTQIAAVGAASPLAVNLHVNPEPAAPGEQTIVTVHVSNTSALPVVDTSLFLRHAIGTATFGETLVLGGADTNNSCFRLGSGTICSPNEFLILPIDAINPGQSREFSFPVSIATGSAPGTLIDWDLQMFESSGQQSHYTTSVPVDSNAAVTLSLSQDKDPAAPNDTIEYTLNYGNSSNANVTGSAVTLTLPDAVTLLSATGSASVDGQVLTWDAGNLLPESVAAQRIRVVVDPTAAPGDRLTATANIAGTSNFRPSQRQITRSAYVNAARPLDVTMHVNTLPAQPGEQTMVTVTVGNRSALPVVDASLFVRYPEFVSNLTESLVLGGIDVSNSCFRNGSGTVCSVNEFMQFDVGTLNPGTSREYRFPVSVAATTAPGTMIDWAVRVFESTGEQSYERITVPVDNNAVANVSVTQNKDPVEPGDALIYVIRYGNASNGNIENATLAFEMPEGVNFEVASTGVGASGETVTWNLGTLAAGDIGQQSVLVTVNSGVAPGTVLSAGSAIDGTANFRPTVRRSTDTTVVGAAGPLTLSLQVNPTPATAGLATSVGMVLINTSDLPVLDASVVVRHPTGVNNVAESNITGGLDATNSCFRNGSGTVCSLNEFMIWNFVELLPGEARELGLPPTVSATVADGSLIPWSARVTEGGGSMLWESVSVPVGDDPIGDVDGDTIGDTFDNCTLDHNTQQQDVDNDGYGNSCDADFDQNCTTNVQDLGTLRSVFFSDDPLVDLNGDGVVNVSDLGILRALFFAPPGPSATVGECD